MLKPGHVFESLAGPGQTMLAVAVQIGYAAVVFFSSMVEKSGMSIYIIVAYRLVFAAVIAVTLALIFARECRPKLTWTVLLQAFLAGLLGGPMAQILLGESISLSSVTFGMALINLIPAMTFALAIAFRLDSLRMRTASGRAKLFGIVIGLCGGMLFTFYRGPRINTWSTHMDLLHLEKLRDNREVVQPRKVSIRFLAVLYALGHCMCNSLWLIIQVITLRQFFPPSLG
ncbi:WAT1-RELATED PROTEIN [Salix viminalis]|uniref:WAT1-RELATED PROTEIN n=1 Tax=Salix viminalis TaxID=40686 RepID=A0A9Q0YXJ7_SALVM|nr:WAT1-RELATED PROTEIN [Salix viminalis]